ncbi:hypothetical protein CERZMDRAFT_31465 [Cercospora zeae-maydis SCOH1-5]|uniref:Uncharacterized protein n=1 Tax=Cercospora zeae-maydis SCOH1-5 TaxID=717836 RepID=A0A6A6FWI3_9PEZI|nr:hypothetical protein CERZMDRAFT_31465 [Cercospora zeae-maydis SCOH1-5]
MAPISRKPHLTFPEPPTKDSIISYPATGVLLVHLNKPKGLNCINAEFTQELERIWEWLDKEPAFTVGIITGTGRAFSAGADLKEWNKLNTANTPKSISGTGFGGLSRRGGKKPVIAAVNGICFGGGCEMIVNCDLVIASQKATFALPEVKVGVVAAAGALPRIIRTIGRPRAMEMALTGRTVSAREAMEWGLVNKVVGDREGEVVEAAVEYAKMIAANSPDAVIVSREGIKLGWEGMGAEDATKYALENWQPKLQAGENMAEGVRAFVEKRKPKWKPSKL